jgi:hypothetical protein
MKSEEKMHAGTIGVVFGAKWLFKGHKDSSITIDTKKTKYWREQH